MSTFNLGLPTDIPWTRKCFTDDMVHSPICGSAPPTPWRPSIAVFEFTPDDEYQSLLLTDNQRITYLKVTVSITPDAPEIPSNYLAKFVPRSYTGAVSKVYSCYGALLQVSLGPAGGGSARDLYFADFEPKKRELFEAVSSTGQIASGSQNSISLGKSAMNSASTESLNTFNAGLSFNVAGVGVEAGGSTQTRTSTGSERSEVTSVDRSTERREIQSHTTQLSQLYNLFQSFHVGTNRAVFFMEPRPHVLQSQATFINGPRALEGIQDIFLVVVRPQSITDFCVSVNLQTAHLDMPAQFADDPIEDTELVSYEVVGESPAGTPVDQQGYTSKYFSFEPPSGWIIDVDKTSEEGINVTEDKPGWSDLPSKTSIESISSARVVLKGESSWQTYFTGNWLTGITWHENKGSLKFNFLIHLKKKKPSIRESLKSMFINTRNLCCCPSSSVGSGPGGGSGDGGGGGGGTLEDCEQGGDPNPPVRDPSRVVTWPGMNLTRELGQIDVVSGPATESALLQAGEIVAVIRRELLKAVNITDGSDCPRPFVKSDVFFSRVTEIIERYGLNSDLGTTISTSAVIPPHYRSGILRNKGNITVGSFLRTDAWELSGLLNTSVDEVLSTKEQILMAMASRDHEALPSMGTVVGVRIGSTYPDPNNVRTLQEMAGTAAILQVRHGDKPNVVDITFSDAPDGPSITDSAITITKDGTPVSKQIVRISSNTIRLMTSVSLDAGALYMINVNGTTSPQVTFNGQNLDGEPLALPSGDGVAGGDFRVAMRVIGAPSTTIPPETAFATVTHIAIASSVPDAGNPRLLQSMVDPKNMMVMNYSDQPDIIRIAFSEQPDSGTVTTDSCLVTLDGAAVNTTVTLNMDATATIKITDTIEPNGVYTITLKGTGSDKIEFDARPLDGEPLALPSGNHVEGGDFIFMMKPYQVPTPSAPPLPATLLKVVGARVMSTTPDEEHPRILSRMIHPSGVQVVNIADAPDIIEIDFNYQPAPAWIGDQSLIIMKGTTPVSVDYVTATGTTARFLILDPLEGGETYDVKVVGTGTDALRFMGKYLDGEPLGIPSGDGVAGGDFTFRLRVDNAQVVVTPGPLLRVVAVGIRTTASPGPLLLTQMSHPSETLLAASVDQPDVVEVTFNRVPDSGTVTTTTFIMESGSSTLTGTVTMTAEKTARLILNDPLTAGNYTVTLIGTGSSDKITYHDEPLDGDPLALPSGDGTAGGDFKFDVTVYTGITP